MLNTTRNQLSPIAAAKLPGSPSKQALMKINNSTLKVNGNSTLDAAALGTIGTTLNN